jgi:hypothetical protein
MLLDSYEFLKELNKKIKPIKGCRHNITLDENNKVTITIMQDNLILPFILDYNETKTGVRIETIKEIKEKIQGMLL